MRAIVLAASLLYPFTAVYAASFPVTSDHWPKTYDRHFRKFSKRYFGPHFNWHWFKAQGIAESRLNPAAKSAKGAVGIMQILPSTFKEITRSNPQFTNIRDPKWNIAAGVFYDRQLYRKWRSPLPDRERMLLTLASYNAGYSRVLKAFKRTQEPLASWQHVSPFLTKQTRHYVTFINELMRGKHRRLRGLEKSLHPSN